MGVPEPLQESKAALLQPEVPHGGDESGAELYANDA